MEAAYITVIVLQCFLVGFLVVGLKAAARERDKARRALNRLLLRMARKQDGVDWMSLQGNSTSVGGHVE